MPKPTPAELRRLADECCACQHSRALTDLFQPQDRSPGWSYSMLVKVFAGSWDAFVVLLPEGWLWRRDPWMLQVWLPGPIPPGRVDTDHPQPRHGVAAILRAMAAKMEGEGTAPV